MHSVTLTTLNTSPSSKKRGYGHIDDIVDWDYGVSNKAIILARAEIDFRRPARFTDRLFVRTRCSAIGNKSFTLEYEIVRKGKENEELIASAKTVIAMYDYGLNESIRVPDDWREKLRAYDQP